MAARTYFTPAQLAQRTAHRRAIEAVNWGIPAVDTELMLQAAINAGAGANQMTYWSGLFGWKNQTLTPNPNAIYFMPFYDTSKVGAMVLEIPPAEGGSITGSVMDRWQMAIEDVGTAGVDKGKGAKYLILPPGYSSAVPEGYIPMPSLSYVGSALLRSILKSGSEADVWAAVEYGKRIKLYPLSAAANPPETARIDLMDTVYDATVPYDIRFFETLHIIVQIEPWLERDKVMIDMLKSIGIEKGKKFAPGQAEVAMLESAAQEALARFEYLYETRYEPHNTGQHWFLPADTQLMENVGNGFTSTGSYPIDARGTAYYCAFSGIKHMGAGQYYLFVSRDKDGDPLNGARRYKLHIPPKPPVHQYWSVTAYDFATHALIRDTPYSSRSSNSPDLQENADGSVDIHFGPEPPNGIKTNWVPTKPGGRFEGLFRFYGPDKPLFDKSWVLPDIEKSE